MGVGIHTLVTKYLNKQDYEAFQAFTNYSEVFKDQFCPKKQQKKSIKKEGGTNIEEGQGKK